MALPGLPGFTLFFTDGYQQDRSSCVVFGGRAIAGNTAFVSRRFSPGRRMDAGMVARMGSEQAVSRLAALRVCCLWMGQVRALPVRRSALCPAIVWCESLAHAIGSACILRGGSAFPVFVPAAHRWCEVPGMAKHPRNIPAGPFTASLPGFAVGGVHAAGVVPCFGSFQAVAPGLPDRFNLVSAGC